MQRKHQKPRYTHEDIQNDLIECLIGNYWMGALSSIILAFVLAFELIHTQNVERQSYIIWFISIFIIILLRIYLNILYDKNKAKRTEHFYNLFFLGSALTALAFGVLGSFLMPSDMAHQAFILIIISGLLAGSVQSLAPSYTINICYILLILIPILSWQAFQIYQGKAIYIGILLSMILYCIFSSVVAYRNYQMLVLNIKLKYENIEMNKMLEQTATHDTLTGLFNRYHLNEYLTSELAHAKREHLNLALIMIDIDKFKHYNDKYGHSTGDEVLKQLGEFLKTHVRGHDIACRIGGDEFVIVLSNCDSERAMRRAQELQQKAKELKLILKNKTENINLSMGIAIYPEHGTIMDELLIAADAAMYKAKQDNGNQVVLYS